ncbi:MAG: T9SS type A sorting domain-containing protein [Bacteroidetes bacterium]|nr:T9SS type A sorting domain-containing protein [Bacteroidota bacterium]
MPNLIMFSQISNTANIYFDYNTAVVTNTVILTVTPVGVNAIHANEKMQLYPNPVHQTVQLKSSNAKPLGRIELFNSDGKLIDSKTISSATFDWQVESLPDGVYLFKEKIGRKNCETVVLCL